MREERGKEGRKANEGEARGVLDGGSLDQSADFEAAPAPSLALLRTFPTNERMVRGALCALERGTGVSLEIARSSGSRRERSQLDGERASENK